MKPIEQKLVITIKKALYGETKEKTNLYYDQKKRDFTPINRQIRAPRVLCIDNEDNNLGVIDTFQALRIAEEKNLDLVQVSPPSRDRPPTCRVMDYGKFKYQQSKNQKSAAKKARANEIKVKEIKFRPNTNLNDLKTKAVKAEEFLNDGHKVKISIVFKGREISHQDLGKQTLQTFVDLVSNMVLVEQPILSGKVLSAVGAKRTEQ